MRVNRANSLFVILFGLSFLGLTRNASAKDLYFPHYAEGAGWVFQISVSNLSSGYTSGKIKFYDNFGSPQILSFTAGLSSEFNLNIGPSGTQTFITTGTGSSLKTGYVVVELDQEDVTGMLVFRHQSGMEVSVPPQAPGKKFAMLVEESQVLSTGMAVAFQSEGQPISLKLYTTQGVLMSNQIWNVGRKQGAKFLWEMFGNLGNFQGLLTLESAVPFSCLGLRLGTASMSAIPIYDSRMGLLPVISITSPTTDPVYTANSSSISLSGWATNNLAINSITWSNDRGGSGNCAGTTTWSCSVTNLYSGQNVITLTVIDSAGNSNSDTLTVSYAPPDTASPSVNITSPTSNATYISVTSPINIGGTASDNVGVASIVWSNSRGGSGNCSGTTSWSCSGITLEAGSNLIAITARDAADNLGIDSLTVTYSTVTVDTAPPVATITSPTSNSTYSTSSSPLTLGGTASDNIGVTSVSWSNDRFGSGNCAGTTSWSCSGITLQTGTNVITVTARDAAGNVGQAKLTVTYTPPTSTVTSVSVSCSPTPIQSGQTSQCNATVYGTGNFSTAVTWSASAGTITTGGQYTPPTVSANIQVTITATSVQNSAKSGSTSVTVQPLNTDLVVRGISQVNYQSDTTRYVEFLVQNIGSSSYCSIYPMTRFSTPSIWLPTVKSQTYAAGDGSLSDNCLRPGDLGVTGTGYSLSIPLLTPTDLLFQATKSAVYAPDPQLTIVSVGPSNSSNYPYNVKIANQSQKTAGVIRGKAILRDASGNFLGNVELQDGYPNAFPMGDDRCMTTDSTLATYNCIKGGRTKDFRIGNTSGYNWASVASIQVLPTWSSLAGKEILFPPVSHATIRMTALSGAGSTGKYSYSADAVFERDGTVFFNGVGGGYGERGINVAAIDPRTGVILELKSYDTWAESDADSRLVSFLSSLPAGTIIMMAVSDEGSSSLNSASRTAITKLVGSQQIQGLAYWDNWALVSAIGRTTPFAEEIVHYTQTGMKAAVAEYSIILP